MCRHLAYVGPPRTVADVLTAGHHSLYRQSWAPADMRGGGTINADGFGAVWWTGGEPAVSAYRSASPMWSDPAIAGVLTGVRSTGIVGAVRSATEGMPINRESCAPFTDGRWAFSHNGRVVGWPESVAALAEWLPAVELLRMPALTDSALLWTLLRRRLDASPPAVALRATVLDVLEAAPESRLNLLISDGSGVWATAVGHSLSARVDEASALVVSEPVDDRPDWTAVPQGHVVEAWPGHLSVTEMGLSKVKGEVGR